jgi:phage host-nuclease inhibitor protein Gam
VSTETKAITRDDAIHAANTYREVTMHIERINNHIKQKQAALAAKFESDLANLIAAQNDSKDTLEAYVQANQEEMLGNARSTDFAGLKIGYRKATAKLITIGKRTWDKVLETIMGDEEWKREYVKVKEEIDKTALKKADAEVLKALGVKVDQPDDFFVKL